MEPRDRVCFETDPTRNPMRVKAVSPFVDMVELEEFEGAWVWTQGLRLLDFAIPMVDTHVPDTINDQLKFLGF